MLFSGNMLNRFRISAFCDRYLIQKFILLKEPWTFVRFGQSMDLLGIGSGMVLA
jgi:hypothetical protein